MMPSQRVSSPSYLQLFIVDNLKHLTHFIVVSPVSALDASMSSSKPAAKASFDSFPAQVSSSVVPSLPILELVCWASLAVQAVPPINVVDVASGQHILSTSTKERSSAPCPPTGDESTLSATKKND
jgi:hypothetical protein